MTTPRRRLWASGALVALAAAGCGAGSAGGASTTTRSTAAVPPTAAPTTAAPATTVPVTTTPAYQPSAPQQTAGAAAAALLQAWGRQDRIAAAAVATPAAVAALFVDPGRALQSRGCSDGAPPITCSYADRSSANGHFYEINVVQTTSGGWYVGSVQIEG